MAKALDRVVYAHSLKMKILGMGAIGHITEGIINRTDYYLPAAIIALCQVKNKHWYE